MNAEIHAKLSIKKISNPTKEDYDFFYKLHDFMDCSKEVESSNLHRCLTHHLWFIKRVVIPIFGASFKASDDRFINLKDDMESNHIVADFRNKFLPTLTDYISLIKSESSDEEVFNEFQKEHKQFFNSNPLVKEFMLSPLSNTGILSSLWLTHNTWMVGEILPRVFPNIVGSLEIRDWKAYSPSIMFNRMRYEDWVQNGAGFPPSFSKIKTYREEKTRQFDKVVYDGSLTKRMDTRLD